MVQQNELLLWRCQHCADEFRGDLETDEVIALRKELMALRARDAGQAAWERFIQQHEYPRGPLHSTNYLILWAKEEVTLLSLDRLQDMGTTQSIHMAHFSILFFIFFSS